MISEKICPKCKVVKPSKAYSISRSTKDGINWACKVCHNAYVVKRYRELKGAGKLISSVLASWFKTVPCMDCGSLYPYHIMDFDHRPEELKSFGLAKIGGRLVNKDRMIKVLSEIAKCDYVCSNCHRNRTHIRVTTRNKEVEKNDYEKL